MDLLLMGLLAAAAGAGVGYATGRGRRVQSARRVAAEAALETRFVALSEVLEARFVALSERLAKDREELEWRFGVIDAALGRHSDYGQELRDGLEAVKGDLDQRLAAAVAALQERNAEIDAALGRHAVNGQELRDGLEALKGDLDRRLHLFDVDLNTAAQRLSAMDAAVNVQWAEQLQELRTLLEEESERVKELAVEQRVQGSAVQKLRDCTIGREELERLAAVVQRLEHLTGNATGNAERIEALELAQGVSDGRLAQLEQRLAEATSHMANLAQDTLAAIGELKGELAGELETMGDRVEKVDADQQQLLELLERRLGEVQDFIIKAADDAKARRESLQSSPLPPVGGVAELLQQQQALQQAFRQRRPAVAAVFPTVPQEVGL